MNRTRAALALALAVAVFPRTAAADREACARSYEAAQGSRLEGKLLDARRELLVCAQDSCPAVLRKDCVTWLGEVERETPTIAVRVVGPDGCDRPDAEVTVDGRTVAHAAEGVAFPLDPGPHKVRATIGTTSTEQAAVVAASERRRTVTIAFGGATTCARGGAGAALPAPERGAERKPLPRSIFVLGGIGVVAAGIATAFAVSGWSQKGDLDACKGACAQGEVDTMRRTFVVADLGALVAVGTVLAAGVVYLTR